MAMEAQHLIDISLAKITQARFSRGGVSLHKNLLVATVLQKAKFMFMEEISHMVHHYYPRRKTGEICDNDDDIDIMEGEDKEMDDSEDMTRGRPSLFEIYTRTGRASPINSTGGSIIVHHNIKRLNDEEEIDDLHDDVDEDDDDIDCENVFCDDPSATGTENNKLPTYLDLDKNQIHHQKWRRNCLKRRKDTDTSSSSSDEDDVIVKRNKSDSDIVITPPPLPALIEENNSDANEHPHRDRHHNNSSSSSDDDDEENQGQAEEEIEISGNFPQRSVDIERITSLVSIFNFTAPSSTQSSSSTSSSSVTQIPPSTSPTNDLCSSQATIATERENNTISPRPFLAMTV